MKDGSQKLIKGNVCIGGISFSPNGQYAVAYDKREQDWFFFNVTTGEMTNLTENMGVSFVDDEHDTPSLASANGSAVWFENNQSFLIRDKFDFWQFDLKNLSAPKMFTENYGRNNNTQLTITQIIEDPDKASGNPMARMFGGGMELKMNEPIYFTTYNRTSKENGLAMKEIKKKKLL